MEDDQQFCLRWNNHQSTLIQNFDTLLEHGTLVDCTLAAEGKYLKAHKVVLSACSPYFEGLLSEHYDKHPVFILKDVKFKELKAMMDYMYRGEVNISQDQLTALLKAAESLQIKGLSDSRTGGNGSSSSKPDTRQAKTSSQPTAASVDIPHASSGLTIEKNSKVPRQSLAQASVGDLPEDSVSPQLTRGLSSREGSQSPTSRKRKRLRRRSLGDDNNSVENHEASNSSDVNVPALGIAAVAEDKSHHESSDSLGRSALMQQLTKPADEMTQLPIEKPEPSEEMIQPKSEYLDDQEESVEDLTLDDDMNDMSEMNEQDSSRAGPSTHDPSQHAGLASWHIAGDRSNASGVVAAAGAPGATDEVFLAAHEAVQAQRDSQDALYLDENDDSDNSTSILIKENGLSTPGKVSITYDTDYCQTNLINFLQTMDDGDHLPIFHSTTSPVSKRVSLRVSTQLRTGSCSKITDDRKIRNDTQPSTETEESADDSSESSDSDSSDSESESIMVIKHKGVKRPFEIKVENITNGFKYVNLENTSENAEMRPRKRKGDVVRKRSNKRRSTGTSDDPASNLRFKCAYCHTSAARCCDISRHLNTRHQGAEPKYHDRWTNSIHTLRPRVKLPQASYTCEGCTKVLSSRSGILKHFGTCKKITTKSVPQGALDVIAANAGKSLPTIMDVKPWPLSAASTSVSTVASTSVSTVANTSAAAVANTSVLSTEDHSLSSSTNISLHNPVNISLPSIASTSSNEALATNILQTPSCSTSQGMTLYTSTADDTGLFGNVPESMLPNMATFEHIPQSNINTLLSSTVETMQSNALQALLNKALQALPASALSFATSTPTSIKDEKPPSPGDTFVSNVAQPLPSNMLHAPSGNVRALSSNLSQAQPSTSSTNISQMIDVKMPQSSSVKKSNKKKKKCQKSFTCDNCTKVLISRSGMVNHVKKCTPQKPYSKPSDKPLVCPHCDIRYCKKDSLRRHILTRHRQNDNVN